MEHPLRTFRRSQDRITLDALAVATGISKASLSRIENGLQQPDFEMIRKLVAFSTDRGGALTAEHFVNFAPTDRPSANKPAAPQGKEAA